MNLQSIKELPIVGYLPYGDGPGFALPILAHPTNEDARCVQEIDEYSNVVQGFQILEGDLSSVVAIPKGNVARVAEEQIFCFLEENGTLHLGNLPHLTPTLKQYARENSDKPAIALQIAELVGTSQEKNAARTRMRHVIRERSGASTAYSFYEVSALHAALWDHLLELAPNLEAAARILSKRSRIRPRIDESGEIFVELSDLDPSDYSNATAAEISKSLAVEFVAVEPYEEPAAPPQNHRKKRPEKATDDDLDTSTIENAYFDNSTDLDLFPLTQFEDPEWDTIWLRSWQSAAPHSSSRHNLILTAEQWLGHPPNNSKRWYRIWVLTLRAAHSKDLRYRLYMLGFRRVLNTQLDDQEWLSLWNELMKSDETLRFETQSQLLELALQWLDLDRFHPRWASVWRKIWDTSSRHSERTPRLAAYGVSWLEQTNSQHRGWVSVWRALWSEYRDTDSSQHILQIGKSWLDTVDATNPGWRTVWDQAIEHSKKSQREPLVLLAYRQMSIPRIGNNWLPIWEKLFRFSDAIGRKKLSEIGIGRLKTIFSSKAYHLHPERNRILDRIFEIDEPSHRQFATEYAIAFLKTQSKWANLPRWWHQLFDTSSTEQRSSLIKHGIGWLVDHPEHDEWLTVWKKAFEFSDSEDEDYLLEIGIRKLNTSSLDGSLWQQYHESLIHLSKSKQRQKLFSWGKSKSYPQISLYPTLKL